MRRRGLLGGLALLPGAVRAATCARVTVAAMPLRLIEGFPIVPASIAGRAVTLVVDTGAQGMLVTPEAAAELALPLRGMVPMYGTGGGREARVVLLPGLRLGGAAMPDLLSPVAPLPVPFSVQPVLAGLLGAPLLSRFDLDIDAPGERLSFFLPANCEPPFRGTVLPLEVSPRQEPFVPVRVNGETLLALLDTGSRGTILGESAARRLRLHAPVLASPAIGVDGTPQPMGQATVRLALGDEAPVETPVSVSALQLERGDMLLGMDAMRRRRVWLGYARGEVLFSPVVPGA